MPKGTGLQDLRIVYTPKRIFLIPFGRIGCFRCRRGKIPPTSPSPSRNGPQHRTLLDKGQRLIFSAAEYQRARESLLEKKMAAQGDPLQSATSWRGSELGHSLLPVPGERRHHEGRTKKCLAGCRHLRAEKSRSRHGAHRPKLYEANKKSFSNNGFETISNQTPSEWR